MKYITRLKSEIKCENSSIKVIYIVQLTKSKFTDFIKNVQLYEHVQLYTYSWNQNHCRLYSFFYLWNVSKEFVICNCCRWYISIETLFKILFNNKIMFLAKSFLKLKLHLTLLFFHNFVLKFECKNILKYFLFSSLNMSNCPKMRKFPLRCVKFWRKLFNCVWKAKVFHASWIV